MEQLPEDVVEFRLSAGALRLAVEVHLRHAGERWVAKAGIRGEQQVGLGATPRQALQAALATLDARAIRALLADTALLEPSIAIASLTAG
jgi:hypothetical protein